MRTLSGPQETALTAAAANGIEARDFFYIRARDRADNSDAYAYFWNDLGPITANRVDGESGSTIADTFAGSGTLIRRSPIVLAADLSVRTVTVTLNQTDAAIDAYVRGYDLKNAYAEIHIGIFSPATHALIGDLVPQFSGFVDGCRIETPARGGSGSVELRLVSHTRELTRVSTAVRSHEDQLTRNPSDNFFQYAGIMGSVELFWGMQRVIGAKAASARPASSARLLGPTHT